MNKYRSINEISNDSRFYIDAKDACRIIANRGGGRYRVAFVRIGSILRFLEGKITTLYETDVFPYLLGTEEGKEKYDYYCKTYPSSFRNETNYKNLIAEMQRQDYDINKGAIVIDENNFIIDGQHRACIMLYKYGPFRKIAVVRIISGKHYGKKWKIKLMYNKMIALVHNCFECIKRFVK